MRHTFLLALLIIVSACQFGEKQKQATLIIEEEPIARYIDYRVEKIDEKYGPCVKDSTSKNCILFQLEYPVITGKVAEDIVEKINESIETDILASAPIEKNGNRTVRGMISGLSNSYQDLLEEFEDYEQAWVIEINADILYQEETYISLASILFNYTGGAHPNNSQLYRSYSLKTGQRLRLDDLFIEGYQTSLNQSAEIEFRMQKEIPPTNTLESAGYWFEDDRFVINDNFAVINQSLIFFFNPYEIGPYALGATELELKLTDYIDLIDPNGPIGYLKDQK